MSYIKNSGRGLTASIILGATSLAVTSQAANTAHAMEESTNSSSNKTSKEDIIEFAKKNKLQQEVTKFAIDKKIPVKFMESMNNIIEELKNKGEILKGEPVEFNIPEVSGNKNSKFAEYAIKSTLSVLNKDKNKKGFWYCINYSTTHDYENMKDYVLFGNKTMKLEYVFYDDIIDKFVKLMNTNSLTEMRDLKKYVQDVVESNIEFMPAIIKCALNHINPSQFFNHIADPRSFMVKNDRGIYEDSFKDRMVAPFQTFLAENRTFIKKNSNYLRFIEKVLLRIRGDLSAVSKEAKEVFSVTEKNLSTKEIEKLTRSTFQSYKRLFNGDDTTYKVHINLLNKIRKDYDNATTEEERVFLKDYAKFIFAFIFMNRCEDENFFEKMSEILEMRQEWENLDPKLNNNVQEKTAVQYNKK